MVGALGLYAAAAHALDDTSTELTGVLAVQAGATLSNVEVFQATRRRADNLSNAMHSRAGIEQAKGVLMGREGCSADEAFRLLRHTSQTQHVKLHEVAERLLAAARDDRRP